MTVRSFDQEQRDLVSRRLRLIGIDAAWVLYDGISPAGYQRIVQSRSGGRLYNPWTRRIVTVFTPWPNVSRETLMGVLAAIKGLRRRRGDRGWR